MTGKRTGGAAVSRRPLRRRLGVIQHDDWPVHHAVGVARLDSVSDDALVAGMAMRDGDAAAAFVRRFERRVFGLAVHVTGQRSLADDIAQVAFTRAWAAASTYDGRRGSVANWLLTITRNAAIDAVRARRLYPVDDERLGRLVDATMRGDGLAGDRTADAAITNADAAAVLERLRALPIEQARAVVLAVLGGCTGEEIAERDGLALGTVKGRIRLGLRRLRTDLASWTEDTER